MLYNVISVVLAIIPAVVLIFFVVGKDKKQPEPPKQLARAFFFGTLSVLATFLISAILDLFVTYGDQSIMGQLGMAFWGAAIPEECAKLLMLWLVLRKNIYFDEHYDGIVYAVMVGLGFASVENIMYMTNFYDEWLSVGVSRALLSVPAHYAFAVFMGYFYSLAHFSRSNSLQYYLLAILVPILLHGIYDALLMVGGVMSPVAESLLFVACCYLCYRMHKEAIRRLDLHLHADANMDPTDDSRI
jgi:RsiW-degrading membrane proteinase PrsW (M82 family)